MAKGIQNMVGDTKCGSPLAIFCIPTHFVGDTLSGTTPADNWSVDNWPVTFWGVGQLASDFLKVVLEFFFFFQFY